MRHAGRWQRRRAAAAAAAFSAPPPLPLHPYLGRVVRLGVLVPKCPHAVQGQDLAVRRRRARLGQPLVRPRAVHDLGRGAREGASAGGVNRAAGHAERARSPPACSGAGNGKAPLSSTRAQRPRSPGNAHHEAHGGALVQDLEHLWKHGHGAGHRRQLSMVADVLDCVEGWGEQGCVPAPTATLLPGSQRRQRPCPCLPAILRPGRQTARARHTMHSGRSAPVSGPSVSYSGTLIMLYAWAAASTRHHSGWLTAGGQGGGVRRGGGELPHPPSACSAQRPFRAWPHDREATRVG